MSITSRRNSLRKSSISINSIRNTFASFSKGITNAKQKSDDILKQTRETNLFKSKLIRKDGEFFARRRENVRRKNREDEIESSSITGVAKKEGNIVTRSTRGFLGRIIDFLGVILVGWALVNLPMIIKRLQGLFKLIQKVVGILSGFIDAIRGFLVAIGKPIVNLIDSIRKIDFTNQRKQVQDSTESVNSNLTKLDKDFRESVNDFINDENISRANQLADEIENSDVEQRTNQDVDAAALTPVESQENDKKENITVETQIPDVEPRAEGGDVEPNKPYTVGERGVEVFVPDQSGTIIPNDELVAQNTEVEEEDDDESETEEVMGVLNDNSISKPSEKITSNLDSVSGTPLSIDNSNFSPKPDKNKTDLIASTKSERKDMNVIPVKRKEFKMTGRKKRKNVIMIVEKPVGQGQPVVTGSGQKSTMTNVVNKSSDKMLLELQSVSSLKYT